jgi:hypothetical protein
MKKLKWKDRIMEKQEQRKEGKPTEMKRAV